MRKKHIILMMYSGIRKNIIILRTTYHPENTRGKPGIQVSTRKTPGAPGESPESRFSPGKFQETTRHSCPKPTSCPKRTPPPAKCLEKNQVKVPDRVAMENTREVPGKTQAFSRRIPSAFLVKGWNPTQIPGTFQSSSRNLPG